MGNFRAGSCASVLAVVLSAATPAGAVDCTAEVTAAFERQRKAKAFRMSVETKGDQGTVAMQVDYVPPDRMHQIVRHPSHPEPLETIAIGRWAWGTMGGGWEELQPQFAQAVTAHMRQTLVEPLPQSGSFECLGKVSYEGRDYVAFRSVEGSQGTTQAPDRGPGARPASAAGSLVRTVYVDAASGLPMLNVVGEEIPAAVPVFKGVFSYPDGIKIEAPIGEPEPK